MNPTVITVGDVRLTRVLYLDAAIDPAPVGLTAADVRSVSWAEPLWADGDQVRAAACVWVIEAGDRTIALDPAGNIDDILHDPETTLVHQQAFADAFVAAGIDPAAVDTVLLSHIRERGVDGRAIGPRLAAVLPELARRDERCGSGDLHPRG